MGQQCHIRIPKDRKTIGSVTESVDVSDLKSAGHCARGGSSPPAPTREKCLKLDAITDTSIT